VLMVGVPALLEAQGAGPVLAPVNSTFNVTLTVTNTGAGSALSVLPTIAVSPPGAPVLLVGPVPSGSVSIVSGASQTFTWTCSASGWGAATFTMSVTGSDACGNLAASATVFTLLGMPAALAASGLTAAPDPICTGGLVTITLAVTNTGQVPANVLT